ncbi:MAG: L-2-amino-thiazoline-4-carboxylic acid hydrolase [Eubacteriales bacterium]|nr:L-2-amino-thiazoline-4-carboxylic acid hydrolase [Eubacteriales bacterium]
MAKSRKEDKAARAAKKLCRKIIHKLPAKYRAIDLDALDSEIDELCLRYQDHPAFATHLSKRVVPLLALVRQAMQDYQEDSSLIIPIVQEAYYALEVLPPMRIMAYLLRLPGVKHIFVKKVQEVTTSTYGPKNGFKIEGTEWSKRRARFDVVACPYFEVCSLEGMPELTDVFCTSDEFFNDLHPRVHFNRSETLGRGDSRCDFEYIWDDDQEK